MSSLRVLLARRDYWRLAGVGQLAALPMGMTPLAYTLLTAAALGSYRVGSVLVTVGVFAEVAAAPLVGRLLDRLGIGRGLRGLLLVAAAGYGLLATVGTHAPPPVLVALAVLPALPAGLLSPAVAMNETLLEGTLILGPLLAAGLAILAPTAAIGGLAVALAVAAVLLPRTSRHDHPTGGAPCTSLLRQPRLARWLISGFGAGLLFGSMEVGALGLARRLHGGSGTAALLLAVLSGGSALAGLTYAALGHRLRFTPPRQAATLLAVMACAMIAVTAAGSWIVTGPAIAALGLCAAPLMTTQSLGIESALPEHQRAEGFSLLSSAQGGGYALGSLAVAVLPLSAAQLVGAAGPLAASLILITRANSRLPDQPHAAENVPTTHVR